MTTGFPSPGRWDDAALVAGLRAKVVAAVRDVVPAGAPVAVLDLPNQDNVGDSAIWLGERAVLRELGHDVVYASDRYGHNQAHLQRALPRDGVVLFHGGGNFGDVWPGHHRFRLRVIEASADRPVVVLPQTVGFRSDESRAETGRILDDHGGVRVMCRDARSVSDVQQLSSAPVVLVPDAAFALGVLPRSAPHGLSPLWLARSDSERTGPPLRAPSANSLDWLSPAGTPGHHAAVKAFRRASLRWSPVGSRVSLASRVAAPAYRLGLDRAAQQRVDFGIDLLSGAAVVITDRLHAHILCVLTGTPHVFVDTGYGKLTEFHRAWTTGSHSTAAAPDASSAAQAMAELLSR